MARYKERKPTPCWPSERQQPSAGSRMKACRGRRPRLPGRARPLQRSALRRGEVDGSGQKAGCPEELVPETLRVQPGPGRRGWQRPGRPRLLPRRQEGPVTSLSGTKRGPHVAPASRAGLGELLLSPESSCCSREAGGHQDSRLLSPQLC